MSLGIAAAIVTAVAFGLCGLLFAVAPGPSSAAVSWVLHVDVTSMTRPISAGELIGGLLLFAAYVGVLAGVTGALYNRIAARGSA